MMAQKPEISVVICTFNRPEGLKRVVECCIQQITTDDLCCEIIVSDNSPSGYAENIVQSLNRHGVCVLWVPSSPANIAVARNKGIAASSAEVVVFLDDDMTIEDKWLRSMYEILQRTSADCAISSLIPVSEGKKAVTGMSATFFSRLLDMPDGTPVSPGEKPDMPSVTVATSGSIWRRASCFTDPLPFDPKFGKTGGEDCDLFLRLENRRKKIVWCGSAIAYEWVPASRMGFRYLLMRAFGGGQVFVAVSVQNADRPLLLSLKWMGIGLVQCLGGGLLLGGVAILGIVNPRRFRTLLTSLAFKEAAAFGKMTWFCKFPTYRVENGRRK